MISVDAKVGFIGAGMMASAMMKGLTKAQMLTSKIVASDIDSGAEERITKELNGTFVPTNAQVVAACDVVFLAVKPNIVAKVLKEVRASAEAKDILFVSIAAGVTSESIKQELPERSRVIRVMPNTPCLVGEMAAGFCKGPNAKPEDMTLVGTLLNTLGTAMPCEEKLLNAVTGLSGSGPAYIFVLIEALADGGVRQGIPRATALALAAQTVKGAAQMVLETGKHPGILKDQVCSPGGTTIAGVEALENNGFRAATMSAVSAATARADELSRM